LEQRRELRFRALLRAAGRSPLYRRCLGGHTVDRVRLCDLPPLRKSELMRQFHDWVVDPQIELGVLQRFVAEPANVGKAFLGRYVVWESSGSSGEPGLFVQDAAAMAVYDALEALRRATPRPLLRMVDPWYLSERIAFVGAIGGHFASTVSIARLKQLNPALRQSLSEVSFLQPLARIVSDLNAIDPSIIGTYPSAALLLAQERAAGRLRARPQEVWTGGESLSPATRHFISGAFGCPVLDSYGASEFLSLASECACGGLHLNSDWVILEPVDAHGRAVAPDEPAASVLLTNLANHVQPLIRYDLGDRVTVKSAPCRCGSSLPLIEVQGRCDDALHLGLSGRRVVSVLPLALTTVLEVDAELFDFQLEQTGPAALELRTAKDGAAALQALDKGRQALSRYLVRQGAEGVTIAIQTGCRYQPGRSGKIQRVLRRAASRRVERQVVDRTPPLPGATSATRHAASAAASWRDPSTGSV
jgi:phenylacetate-coenzyme A ligase PaaK-like adenylate-forming protein